MHHYCLFLKDMGWKYRACYIINSNTGHTRSNQQLDKYFKITFAGPPKSTEEKEKKKEKKKGNCKAFSVTHKRNKQIN